MDEHFADLFARYEALAPQHLIKPAARLAIADATPELALARSALGSL
nr:hypothetical protein [Sphingomonas sp.]